MLKPTWVELKAEILSAGFYQRGGTETQECFHFQHLLDKVCKIFHMVCDVLMKESIMLISRGAPRRGEGWTEGPKIKWRRKLRPPAAFRRCEGLSRFHCSASVPWATREAVWGLVYLAAQRMSCVFHAHTHTHTHTERHTKKHMTPKAFLFATRHTFLWPSLQILVCWQPAGFLSCRAEEWRALTHISFPQADKVLW